jgi:arylsulfatase
VTRAIVVVALALATGCRPDCTPAGGGGAPVVLLVVVDTLRADHLGGPHARTPHLDRLAAEGARFTRSYAAANATLPSHASLFTSRTLTGHGVLSNHAKTMTGPATPTVFGSFEAAGYRTAAFVSAYHVGPKMVFGEMMPGLERFAAPERVSKPLRAEETVDSALAWLKGACRTPAFAWIHIWDPHMPYAPPSPWDHAYYTGDPRAPDHHSLDDAEFDWALHDMSPAGRRLRKAPGVVRAVKRALTVSSREAKRLILAPAELRARAPDDATYRHLWETIRPTLSSLHKTLPFNKNVAGMLTGVRDAAYAPAMYAAMYAGEVSYVDGELGRLVSTLEDWGLRDRLVVVVTADHGEGHGEHAIHYNHIGLWEEMARVPLVVWAPGRVAPAVRDELASGLDVAPTLLRLVTLDVPTPMEGHDLLAGTPPRRNLVVETLLDFQIALVDGQWKLVRTLRDYYATTRFHREAGAVELYDLAADPGERSNLATAQPERAAAMGATLDAWQATHGVRGDVPVLVVPPADRQRLRALGYVE